MEGIVDWGMIASWSCHCGVSHEHSVVLRRPCPHLLQDLPRAPPVPDDTLDRALHTPKLASALVRPVQHARLGVEPDRVQQVVDHAAGDDACDLVDWREGWRTALV